MSCNFLIWNVRGVARRVIFFLFAVCRSEPDPGVLRCGALFTDFVYAPADGTRVWGYNNRLESFRISHYQPQYLLQASSLCKGCCSSREFPSRWSLFTVTNPMTRKLCSFLHELNTHVQSSLQPDMPTLIAGDFNLIAAAASDKN